MSIYTSVLQIFANVAAQNIDIEDNFGLREACPWSTLNTAVLEPIPALVLNAVLSANLNVFLNVFIYTAYADHSQ